MEDHPKQKKDRNGGHRVMAVAFDVCIGAAGVWWSLCTVIVFITCFKPKPSQRSVKHIQHDDGSRLTDSAVKAEMEAAMKSSNNLGSKPLSRESKESGSNFNASNDLSGEPPVSVNKPISMGMSAGTLKAQVKPRGAPNPNVHSAYVTPTTATACGDRVMVSQYVARHKDTNSARHKKDPETARAKKDVETARQKKDLDSGKGKKSQDKTKTCH